MAIRTIVSSARNQMRWVVLLLIIAVMLPTVCLLWLMSQAVKNERLAVRQKLVDVYRQRLEKLSTGIDELWSARIALIEQEATITRQPVEMFDLLVGRGNGTSSSKGCNAIIIYDDNDKLLYPVVGGIEKPDELPEEFKEAWDVEFVEEDFARAIRLYEKIFNSVFDDYTHYSALLGEVRCLRKLGEIEKAITLCHQLAYEPTPESISSSSISLIARARILLVELKSQTEEGLSQSDLQSLISSAINYTPNSAYGFLLMSSAMRIFLLHKALEIVEESKWAEVLKPELSRAKELLSAEELAAAVLEKYHTGPPSDSWSEDDVRTLILLLHSSLEKIEGMEWEWAEKLKAQISGAVDLFSDRKVVAAATDRLRPPVLFESWPEDSFRRLQFPETAYGMCYKYSGRVYVLLQKAQSLSSDFDSCGDDLEELGISYRITDNFGTYASGLENPERAAFLKAPLGKFFPGWQIEIHFKDADILKTTAGRQIVVYVWAGLLAVAVMIAAGLLAMRIVSRQIKLNKLKNDFIATVSHELKTPLASIRLLIDTILEGNYKNQQQATEYLQLVSKENVRLTRLIENFMTFSRMERNKRAFRIVRADAAAIAHAAVDAVRTKFENGRCQFLVDINDNLPDVLADHDAMVTVLVNLLDNAYKYSHEEKHIMLRAFAENGTVCYSVSDKGIGISRRAVKKIFTRFYQADRTLSRHAEGCGLGLSIAKFIINAHKGAIFVDSKPGKGSTFTVRLAIAT